MKILVIDFETQDWFLNNDYGSGWVYPDPHERFKIIGCAFSNGPKHWWSDDLVNIKQEISSADVLICHNSNYDIGICLKLGIDISKKTIIDTLIEAKLFNPNLFQYNLNFLSKRFLNKSKTDDELGELAQSLGLVRSKRTNKIKVAKENMFALYEAKPELVQQYAIQDVILCLSLHRFFYNKEMKKQMEFYSDLIKCLLTSRQRGVRIDLDKARESAIFFQDKLSLIQEQAYLLNNKEEINLNSGQDLEKYFLTRHVKVSYTSKNNPCFDEASIEDRNDDPMFQCIKDFRLYDKALNTFAQKFIDMQNVCLGVDSIEGIKYGRLYPEVSALDARTGRFTHKCPNIAQLPARNKEISEKIRSVVIPEKGDNLYAIDFSNQEGRIQVQYAIQEKAQGVFKLQEEFNKNSYLDLHEKVAEIIDKPRKIAKVVNLGLSYGMGNSKLSRQLSFTDEDIEEAEFDLSLNNTKFFWSLKAEEWKVYYDKCLESGINPIPFNLLDPDNKKICVKIWAAKRIREQYNTLMPFLNDTIQSMQNKLKKQGYVLTLGGRKIFTDKNFEYKIFNAAIQGSAADQTSIALVNAYKRGLKILFSVHDEIVISGNDEDAKTLTECMTKAIILNIPVTVGNPEREFNGGKSWAESKV